MKNTISQNPNAKFYSYVRWSSSTQTLGDSERRQSEKANDWCIARKVKLSEETFKGSGVSAKAGANRAEGSQFSELLKFVKAGDFILIEDYDRFSREDSITSLSALRTILKDKNITIVFISENIEVNQNNFMDDNIILPLFFKSFLGHKENTKKTERVKKAWKEKFENMKAGKFETIALPCWLESKDGKYVVIESAAKVIKRMFQLCNEGKGTGEIAIIFNKEKLNPITKRKEHRGYNQGFIINCLKSKKTIGYNVIKNKDNSFEVPNVFPAIIDEKVFYTAQAKIKERNNFTGIKTTDDNILSRLCICKECGSTLYKFTNRPKFVYMRCSGVKLGWHKGASLHFSWFESSIIDTLSEETDFIYSLGKESEQDIKSPIIKGELITLEKKLATISNDYSENPSSVLAGIISKTEAKINELKIQLDNELAIESQYAPFNDAMSDAFEELKANEFMTRFETDSSYRIHIREVLRTIIEKIEVESNTGVYYINFKGGKTPLKVTLHKKGGFAVNGNTYTHTLDYRTGKDMLAKS